MSRILSITVVLLFLAGTAAASSWEAEVVEAVGVGRFSSLKIDKDGNAHLAYVVDDGNRYPLKYAFRDAALKRWFVMNVDFGASFCSLVLDSKQRPHISYADHGTMSGSKLHYAHWDGATWNRQAIPLNSDVIGYYTSIGLDSADRPMISFYEYRGPKDTDIKIRLRDVKWNGEYWQVETVDWQEGSGKFNGMAIEPNGSVHIAYANVSSGTAGMRYAYWNGKSWSLEILEGHEQNNGGYVGPNASITLDKEGHPHVAYMNVSTPLLKYAVRTSAGWTIEAVDSIAKVGYPDRNSIALDDQGRPYISYYDAGRGQLKLAHREGQNWMTMVVDRNFSGITSSLQIDRGTIWIAYGDEANGAIKVAHSEIEPGAPSKLAGFASGKAAVPEKH